MSDALWIILPIADMTEIVDATEAPWFRDELGGICRQQGWGFICVESKP